MQVEKTCHIVCIPANDNPAGLASAVLRNLGAVEHRGGGQLGIISRAGELPPGQSRKLLYVPLEGYLYHLLKRFMLHVF